MAATSIPFVPFVSVAAIYRAFISILSSISKVWGFRGSRGLIDRTWIRNHILEACFDCGIGQTLTASFLASLNIFGALTAVQTAILVLEMVGGIAFMHERLYWLQKDAGSEVITTEALDNVAKTYRKGAERKVLCAHIEYHVTMANCYNRQHCIDVVGKAISLARDPDHARYTDPHTAAR